MSSGTVRAVLSGTVKPLGSTSSGIDKRPVEGSVFVERLGIVGDQQADLRVHGGSDKAVHCYAWHHYASWRDELPGCPLLDAPGAFGENFSVDGIDEYSVCIGDCWRVGSAVFLVTQGRQPCFKLNLRFGVADMATQVQNNLRAGWYLRVIEPGVVAAGNTLELLDRPHPQYSIAALLSLIRDRETAPQHLASVLELPLSSSWRRLFEKRLQTGQSEDWSGRLLGS